MSPVAHIFNYEVPDWAPLVQAVALAGLAPEVTGEFMWMCEDPQGVHQYKHRLTRRYVHVNEKTLSPVTVARLHSARCGFCVGVAGITGTVNCPIHAAKPKRVLLTRGTSWQNVRAWRVLEMTEEPNLLTCYKRAQLSAVLTADEALRVTFKRFPGSEVYMWDEPDYIPGPSVAGRKAVRVVATVNRNGAYAVEGKQ